MGKGRRESNNNDFTISRSSSSSRTYAISYYISDEPATENLTIVFILAVGEAKGRLNSLLFLLLGSPIGKISIQDVESYRNLSGLEEQVFPYLEFTFITIRRLAS